MSSPLTTVSVSSATKRDNTADEYEHLETHKTVLLYLPKVRLYVLDMVVLHLKALPSTRS